MSLTDADGNLLKGIRMIGTAQQVTGTHVTCQLGAAETTLRLPLSMVSPCPQSVSAPTYYVVVNENIKEVRGLLLPATAVIPYYHKTREDADKELAEIIRKNPRPTSNTASVAAEANADTTSHREHNNASTTASTGPSTPVTQVRKRRRHRGRRKSRAAPVAAPANDTRDVPASNTRVSPANGSDTRASPASDMRASDTADSPESSEVG